MITRLLDNNLQLLSKEVTSVRPVQRGKEVVNFLLDGSLHIQTVGAPMKGFEIDIVCDSARQAAVDGHATAKTVLKFDRGGVRHDVIILGDPEWSDYADLSYSGRLLLIILAEGAL